MGPLLTLLKFESLLKRSHSFLPMKNEILKKLSKVVQDSDSTIEPPEITSVFASQELKPAPETFPQNLEPTTPAVSLITVISETNQFVKR